MSRPLETRIDTGQAAGVADRPLELVGSMTPAILAIRASDHPRRFEVETLLHVSARHVSAVGYAQNLERRQDTEPDFARAVLAVDPTTLRTSVLTLLLASAMTALDLCAAALWFWIQPGATQHVDLAQVAATAKKAGVAIPPPWSGWLQATRGSHCYLPIQRFRHAQIHRTIREHATLTSGVVWVRPDGTPMGARVRRTVGADPDRVPTHDRGELIDEVATFVPERWIGFWHLFDR